LGMAFGSGFFPMSLKSRYIGKWSTPNIPSIMFTVALLAPFCLATNKFKKLTFLPFKYQEESSEAVRQPW
jgi:hypothetical protein